VRRCGAPAIRCPSESRWSAPAGSRTGRRRPIREKSTRPGIANSSALLDYTDAATYRDAGQGGFEIRTFIAVAAAARGRGEIRHYAPIPIFSVGCTVATMAIE
jgi:2,3-dihydroxyphenylpropionate 1,2-dioxygenase